MTANNGSDPPNPMHPPHPRNRRNRRAKIVCTLGPVSRSPEAIRALVDAGLDVARPNFSHGTHEEHVATAHRLDSRRSDIPLLAFTTEVAVRNQLALSWASRPSWSSVVIDDCCATKKYAGTESHQCSRPGIAGQVWGSPGPRR